MSALEVRVCLPWRCVVLAPEVRAVCAGGACMSAMEVRSSRRRGAKCLRWRCVYVCHGDALFSRGGAKLSALEVQKRLTLHQPYTRSGT